MTCHQVIVNSRYPSRSAIVRLLVWTGVVYGSLMMSLGDSLGRPKSDLGRLKGSARSLNRQQHARAKARLNLHKTWKTARADVAQGKLLRIRESRTLELANVSYPYAHPKLKLLLEKLSRLYWRRCRTPLVVTSLLRPTSKQPRNASSRSVHPAGIAADLRVPPKACRQWLRDTLSAWERAQRVEATREYRPPHFHVVAIPHRLTHEVINGLKGVEQTSRRTRHTARRHKRRSQRHKRRSQRHKRRHKQRHTYRVRRGDSIWALSRRWRVSQDAIMRANRLSSTALQIGQVLKVPSS